LSALRRAQEKCKIPTTHECNKFFQDSGFAFTEEMKNRNALRNLYGIIQFIVRMPPILLARHINPAFPARPVING
jgi:hypothetical protein